MVETGLRPSEICNLTAKMIHLDAPIPYIEVKPEGRVVKAEASLRKMPLVGVSLAAMRLQPNGFPTYRDKSAGRLSAIINEFLADAGLRETPEHTLYSLRHSFEDRLTALQDVPDKIMAYLMGHKYSRPKYGSDPTLPHLQSVLNRIAFPAYPDAL
jgi:integrase